MARIQKAKEDELTHGLAERLRGIWDAYGMADEEDIYGGNRGAQRPLGASVPVCRGRSLDEASGRMEVPLSPYNPFAVRSTCTTSAQRGRVGWTLGDSGAQGCI